MSWTMAQSFDGAGCPCIGELTRISLPKAIRVRFDWKFGLVCLGFALLFFCPDCVGFILAPGVFFRALPGIVFIIS